VKNLKINNDQNHIRNVIDIELLIEREGICNFMGMILEAMESLEKGLIEDIDGFNGSDWHKNLEYQQKVIEFTMSAVDLNTKYDNLDARKVSIDRFRDNLKNIGILA
jgi:hypothetical protein